MKFRIRRIKNNIEFLKLLEIRQKVFVDELNVPPNLEFDGFDDDAIHFVILINDQISGGARLVITGNNGKISRVGILKEFRKKGFGIELMKSIIDFAKGVKLNELNVDAKVIALSFYEKLGFISKGKEFLDAGVLHKKMFLKI